MNQLVNEQIIQQQHCFFNCIITPQYTLISFIIFREPLAVKQSLVIEPVNLCISHIY